MVHLFLNGLIASYILVAVSFFVGPLILLVAAKRRGDRSGDPFLYAGVFLLMAIFWPFAVWIELQRDKFDG